MTHGNQTADKVARQAAGGLLHQGVLISCLDLLKFKPQYTEQDEEWAHEWGFSNTDPNSVWKFNTRGMLLFLHSLVYATFKHLHEGTHYGRDSLMDLVRLHLKGLHFQRTIHKIIQAFQICARNNPKSEHTPVEKGVQYEGLCSLEDW